MLETEVDSVSLPTPAGEITVLPHHVPLVANLVTGEVHYMHNGQREFFAVSGGVIEIKENDEVVVLADTAEFPHEIDVAKAEEGRERARKLMSENVRDQQAFAGAAALLEKNLARIRIAKKHHTRKHTSLQQ